MLPGRSRILHAARVVALSIVVACAGTPTESSGTPKLAARPGKPTLAIVPGVYRLGLGGEDGILLVPDGYNPTVPIPLVVSLHGAGITVDGPFNLLADTARARNFLLLIPASTYYTWDAMLFGYGPDVARLDAMLAYTFAHCNVDAAHIALEGFSDGASYALGLGMNNGALFTTVVGFSPGLITAATPTADRPKFFVSHGREDPVLSFAETENGIVPALRKAGYSVEFVGYEGVHAVPPDIVSRAVSFMLR